MSNHSYASGSRAALNAMHDQIAEKTNAPAINQDDITSLSQAPGSSFGHRTQGLRTGAGFYSGGGDAQSFREQYSDNVAEGLKLSGIETRGPKSGVKEGEGF